MNTLILKHEEMNPITIFPFTLQNQENIELPYKMGICDDPWQIKHKYPKTSGKLWFILVTREKYPNFKLNDWGVYIGIHNLPRRLKKCDGLQGRPKLDYIYIFQKNGLKYQGYPEPFVIQFPEN